MKVTRNAKDGTMFIEGVKASKPDDDTNAVMVSVNQRGHKVVLTYYPCRIEPGKGINGGDSTTANIMSGVSMDLDDMRRRSEKRIVAWRDLVADNLAGERIDDDVCQLLCEMASAQQWTIPWSREF